MAAVQIVPTHVVRASDGQATAGNELHYSPQLGFPVSKKLVGKEKQDSLLACMKVSSNYYLYSELSFVDICSLSLLLAELLKPLEFPE